VTASSAIDEPIAPDCEEPLAAAPGHEGKYQALWRWLREQEPGDIQLTFTDVEDILGIPLPASARVHLPHWYGYQGTALGRAIRDAGWKVRRVDLGTESLTFVPEASV
jgi:hypothetical protein